MRIGKYVSALLATTATASILSSASFVITSSLATTYPAANHSAIENVITSLMVAAFGSLIAAPICAPIAVAFSILLLLSQFAKALQAQRYRCSLAMILAGAPGLFAGFWIGNIACTSVDAWQAPHCILGLGTGVVAFTLSGILSGIVFLRVYFNDMGNAKIGHA